VNHFILKFIKSFRRTIFKNMSLYDPELVKTETSFLGTEKNIATNHSHI